MAVQKWRPQSLLYFLRMHLLTKGLQRVRFDCTSSGRGTEKLHPTDLHRLLPLVPGAGFGGAMSSMAHLQNMAKEPLMRINKLDEKEAGSCFRELWLVVHSLATLIASDDCPYSDEETSQTLTEFSVCICKSIKNIPGFASGIFDQNATFHESVAR